jgi:hypothetical protein
LERTRQLGNIEHFENAKAGNCKPEFNKANDNRESSLETAVQMPRYIGNFKRKGVAWRKSSIVYVHPPERDQWDGLPRTGRGSGPKG